MNKKERYAYVTEHFRRNMPDAASELHFGNAYELLVAVMLSAQCTDKRVNMTTPAFFEAFPNAERLAQASVDEIYEKIKSISYPNSKARHLKGMAEMLTERFNGTVPDDIEEMQQLPGVGRKTANVVSAVWFNKPAMAVDTHVFRVSARIGLTTGAKTPLETERQLVANLSEEEIPIAHHWLILHGRYVCTARNPHCAECGVREACRHYNNRQKQK
ncbi:MAG: endonuclease III [Bacteroidales bacterium]|nr:endonuclease III [Bacteroidales bacterium]